MITFLLFIVLIAIFILKAVKANIKANPNDVWTPAREGGIEDEHSSTQYTAPTASKPNPEPEVVTAPVEEPKLQPIEASHKEQEKRSVPERTPFAPKNVNRIFGLIGKPLGHSTSMVSFKKKFRNEGISADYCNFELESAADIRSLVEHDSKICGLNVTIPYKTDVIPYLDELDDTAREIGAVNVVKVRRDGGNIRLIGYNTDHIGFERSLKPMLPELPVKALVLGTGGASKAVCFALRHMGIEYRSVSRSSTFNILGYYELSPSIMEEHRLIINCTPVGMSPDSEQCPDIPYAYISPEHILFDLIYNPETTLFLKKGAEHGAAIKNGSEMLRIQAEEAWKIWNQ